MPPRNSLADSLLEDLWFGDEHPDRSREKARRSLSAAVALASGLKPFPTTARSALDLLKDPDYSVRRLGAIINQDPALTAGVLRLANSPLLGAQVPCDSLARAISRMGSRQLADLLMVITMQGMFQDAEGHGLEVRDHCIGTAAVARDLGRRAGADPSTLFLAGLLHDIGKLLMIQTGEFEYARLDSRLLKAPDAVHRLEREALDYDHAVLGAEILRLWGLPEVACGAIALHHQPGRAFEQSAELGQRVALLRIADRADYMMQRDAPPTDQWFHNLQQDGTLGYLDITSDELRVIWDDLLEARAKALTALT